MTTTLHAAHSFAVDVRATPGGRLVRASGRLLVGAGADHPAWTTLGAGDGAEHVTLDLEAVTAVDAAGLGRLLRVRQRLGARGGRLAISGAGPRVGHVLTIAGLDAVFDLAPASTTPTSGARRASSRDDAAPGDAPAPAASLLCRCA